MSDGAEKILKLNMSSDTPPDAADVNSRLALQKQNFWQRWILFVATIVVAVFFYWELHTFLRDADGLICLLDKTPFALVVASMLGIIPTALWLTLVATTFRRTKTEKTDNDETVLKALDVVSKVASVLKVMKP